VSDGSQWLPSNIEDVNCVGGFRVVFDNAERDSIPETLRKTGMFSFVAGTSKLWRLASPPGDPLSWVEWDPLAAGADYQHLEWSSGGWQAVYDILLSPVAAGDRYLGPLASTSDLLGKNFVVAGGAGGAALATGGGAGGFLTVRGGAGGAGTAVLGAGAGGAVVLAAGAAGVDGGAGAGASGGIITLVGGNASLGGTAGSGGEVSIWGGAGNEFGGDVLINSGDGGSEASGSITLAISANGASRGSIRLHGGSVSIGDGDSLQFNYSTKILSAVGAANVNLPNNASARFQIEGLSVSANVTSAGLGTLTAGPASDATLLHTHAGPAVETSGEVGVIEVGDVVHTNSDDDMVLSQSGGTLAEAVAVGVKSGANLMTVAGVAVCNMDAGISTKGEVLYLATTPGKVTHAIPGSGHVTVVGYAKTSSATPHVYLQQSRPIVM
jgi:hypothetical protein